MAPANFPSMNALSTGQVGTNTAGLGAGGMAGGVNTVM